jgi:arginyl-tRNA--protein-N-Asp/Glu arginylyltransferase
MKLLFSEAAPDYEHYIFPYAIWSFPEAGETPATFFEAGFLPSSRDLDRFYLTRQIRVQLKQFKPSSENRRILRKGAELKWKLLRREEFELTDQRRSFCKRYADARFGSDVMSDARLTTLFTAPVATHIMVFENGANEEIGYVVLYLEAPRVAFYYYSFYDLDWFERSLGLFLMTSAVQHFSVEQFDCIYLGTCYSERALYKMQFNGCEFFNGFRWSSNTQELKYLVSRQGERPGKHLLESEDYLSIFYQQTPQELAGAFVTVPPPWRDSGENNGGHLTMPAQPKQPN